MRLCFAQSSPGASYLRALGVPATGAVTAWDQGPHAAVLSPGDAVRVIKPGPQGRVHTDWQRWGYTPATDGRKPEHYVQARVNTALSAPALQALWRDGRCLIPLDGWFEWQGEASAAIPFHIRLPRAATMFAAAIADTSEQPGSGVVLVTAQDGNGLLDPQGARPVILADDDARTWLDPSTSPAHARLLAMEFLLPPPAFEWQALESAAPLLPSTVGAPKAPQSASV